MFISQPKLSLSTYTKLNVGLDVAAVGYGFGSREELQAEKPTYHFNTLAELHAAFLKN